MLIRPVIINTAGQITATLPQDLKYNAEKWSGGFLAVSSDESGRNRWGFINAYGQQVVEWGGDRRLGGGNIVSGDADEVIAVGVPIAQDSADLLPALPWSSSATL